MADINSFIRGEKAFDAEGRIGTAGSLVFDGYGVVGNAVTRPSAGVIRVVFENTASATNQQKVFAWQTSPNGTDIYEAFVQNINANTVDILCFFVFKSSGEHLQQNNNGEIYLERRILS